MSRVNFSKIYTVEHNVKVREFGDVDQYHIERLQNGFASVWGFPEKGNKSTKAESEEDDEDEEAETEDEDKETEDEDQDQDDDDEEPLRDDRKGKRRRR